VRDAVFQVQPLLPSDAARPLLRPRRRGSRLLPALPLMTEVAEVQGLAHALRAAVEQGTGDGRLDIRDAGALERSAAHLMAIMLDNQKVTG